jgi:putative transport protein
MIDYVLRALRENPELAVFLTLALGFVVGRVRIGSFRLGNVVGTLLAGVVVGQIGIAVPPTVKVVFFDLFLFATGYKVGPQFIRGLGRSALPQAALTVVLCVTSLLTAFTAAKVMKYDCGTAAGLLAGAFTESTVIGTAGDTIKRLDLPEEEKERLQNNIPIAYAVSYLVGTGFVVWFLSSLAPRLLRVNLREESRALEKELGGGAGRAEGQDDSKDEGEEEEAVEGEIEGEEDSGRRSAYREWDLRAYRLKERSWSGRRIADLEESFAPERVFVERLWRRGRIVAAGPETVLRAGDRIALAARRRVLAGTLALGPEIEDRALLDFPMVTRDVVVTRKELVDRSIAELAEEYGRGIVLQQLTRGGEPIPFVPSTQVERGDVLRLFGAEPAVERVGQAFGYVERPSSATDVVFVGLGIFLGGLFGLLSIHVGNLPLSLTASGGALVMGLVFGWLRSVYPTFGRIPEPALWVFDTIGLAVFIGVVGLGAGPGFVAGLKRTGPSLLVVGFLVAVTPHVVALLFGRYVLKMNPVILLGACSGAGTVTAALRAIQDEAQSKLPVLGYTVPYAIGNILLTAWGPVIVLLTR